MNEIQRILDQMDRAFSGDAWHGPCLQALLDGVSPKMPPGAGFRTHHSIWELVHHIRAWKIIAQHRLKDEVVEVTTERDWPHVWETSEIVWKRALDDLTESHVRLREAVKGLQEERLREKTPACPDSIYVMLHGLVQHDLYHAGQIAILKKAFGPRAASAASAGSRDDKS